ncbi:MAG TPA: bifunctional sugar-1-phosphate nucleotidylyltransferase/acetyltransferase [Anaerolineales bacterium]|nr:bifunctional sugar-1-phosphate nucleotidylyltransferase/acetyltransferase [Anaerolineales bacterium]
MQAVILAGGIGRRIAPLGINKPKAMFRVTGKPIIHHVLDKIKEANIGVEELVIVIGPGENAIQDYLRNGESLGLTIQYVIQEKPLGQANALFAARDYINQDILVLNANDIYDVGLLSELAELGRDKSLDVALVGRVVSEPSKFGVMIINDDGKLIGVVEKPVKAPSNIAVVGLYYFSMKIWEAIESTPMGETDDQFERAYQKLIKPSGNDFISYEGPFETYKYPWDLFLVNDLLLSQLRTEKNSDSAQVSPLAVVDDNVIIEDNVRILEYAVVRGPAYIGSGSIIGNHTLIRGGVSIGKNCVIGHSTEITRSIIGDNCWTHKNFIGDSIISDNCSFGAGTITANLRFDEKPVKIRVGAGRISSGKKYLGVIMAEDCRTGCNSVLLPGKKIGPNSVVGPGVVLDQDLERDKMAVIIDGSFEIIDNHSDFSNVSRDSQLKNLRR